MSKLDRDNHTQTVKTTNLSDPDGFTVLGSYARDVVLEVGRVGRRVVNMDSDGIDVAARASSQEAIEPAGTHSGGSTVGHSGGHKLGLAVERLHVLFPSCCCSGGAEVSLRAKIRFVESVRQVKIIICLYQL